MKEILLEKSVNRHSEIEAAVSIDGSTVGTYNDISYESTDAEAVEDVLKKLYEKGVINLRIVEKAEQYEN
jgi:predicted transcriptional regulator YheO